MQVRRKRDVNSLWIEKWKCVIAFIIIEREGSLYCSGDEGEGENWGIKKDQHEAGLTKQTVFSKLLQTGSVTQQLRFVGFFPWEMFTTKVTVSCGFFIDRVQQIQHLNQTVWTQIEELAHQQGQLL